MTNKSPSGNIQIINIAEILKHNLSIVKNQSLLYGNTGLCIFFYHLSRYTKNSEYEIIASSLLDEVIENINDSIPLDFENGLAGIGWGIEYLLQNKFVEGEADEILEEIDNRIFVFLSEKSPANFELTTGLTGYLFYYINRLNNKAKKPSEVQKININVLIYIINKIDELVTSQFHTIVRDKYFDLFWRFPVVFHALSETFKLQKYNEKISNMVRQWIPYFEAYIPSIQINRLYLATIIMQIVNMTHDKQLEKQIQILLFGTDFDMLLLELDPRLINSRYGLHGLIIVLEHAMKIIPSGFPNYTQLIFTYKRILKRYIPEMNDSISNINPNTGQLGLSEGISGIGLYRMVNLSRRYIY